ncbi:MAG TPA: nucleotidyltransferase family protein [Allosphingosinicella sp.]|jgi:GTP:adenosylcobinamide-phosphate guanylyltransferase|nr:nucleotidyltransferase family protein [Allosphingosinicella sp.]
MGEWTAILLAGERPGESGFARSRGVAAKALIPVAGEPMIARVARTLLAAPSVGRILVLTQAPERLRSEAPPWLGEEPRIRWTASGDTIAASIRAAAGSADAPWPLLVTTADHALLTPDIVERFLADSGGADVAFAMVERQTVEAAWPETKRTWLKARGGQYSGANLFALANARAVAALDLWTGIERDRKKAWRLLAFLGPSILTGALTRTLTLQGAATRIGRKLGLSAKAVVLPYAEAAIDVDKPADLALVERILAELQPG